MKVRIDIDKKNEPDVCEIHVDQRLTRETIRSWDSPHAKEDFPPKEAKPKYVSRLFRISGVQEVWLYPHSVNIHKGGAFSWDDILPKALEVIKAVIDPKGKIIRIGDKPKPKTRRVRRIPIYQDGDGIG